MRPLPRSLNRHLPTVLLVAFIVVPTLILGASGLVLLRHERERLEAQSARSRESLLQQVADDLRSGLEAAREEVEQVLRAFAAQPDESVRREVEASHPLVRHLFVCDAEGQLRLPPPDVPVDEDTERFRVRYHALFSGRLPWFGPEAEQPAPAAAPQMNKLQALREFSGRRVGSYDQNWSAESHRPMVWRAWHWEDQPAMLAYLEDSQTSQIVGMEVEMSALYSRMQVLLTNTHLPDSVLVLYDARQVPLLSTGEIPAAIRPVRVDLGALLPFAQLALYTVEQPGQFDGAAFYLTAAALVILLLLSILATSLLLGGWLQQSRRATLQRTNFVSNVSHEFKTPLTTIRMYTELLLERRVTDPEKTRRYLETMRNESDRLARLVHNVLDFSRLEQGRKQLSPVVLDAVARVREVLHTLEQRFHAAEITVDLDGDDTRQPVYMDQDAFEQVALNLADNAIKYAGPGATLRIRFVEADDKVQMLWMDSGPGIPPRQRKRLFKPFEQGDQRLTRHTGGTGLGLSIAARLARESGGGLCLCDSPLGGACFAWTVPRAKEGESP